MISNDEMRLTLNDLILRICVTDGRVNDFYLGAHLALNILANHEEIRDHHEYMERLDHIIAKEKSSWQACTN